MVHVPQHLHRKSSHVVGVFSGMMRAAGHADFRVDERLDQMFDGGGFRQRVGADRGRSRRRAPST